MANTGLSVAELCDIVEDYTGEPEGTGIKHVRRGYERFLDAQDPRDYEGYIWSFLRPMGTLTLYQNAAGTATGADSGDNTIITASTFVGNDTYAFTPFHVGETLTFNSLSVTGFSFTSDTAVTVVDAAGTYQATDKAYSIKHSGIYQLPDDFGGLLSVPSYTYSSSLSTPPFKMVSRERIQQEWRYSNSDGKSRLCAIMPIQTFTATVGQRYGLAVAPRPDADRVITYFYLKRVDVDALTDSSTTYLLGGPNNSRTIEMAALASAELLHTKGKKTVFKGEFREEMISSIERDRLQSTEAPPTIIDGGL